MKTNYSPIANLHFAVILLSISSCAPILYTNVGQNVPLFREKGEVAFSGGPSSAVGESYGWVTESADGFNMQAAAAVGKSTAFISSFYALKDEGENKSGSGSYFETGIGKFKRSPESKLTGEIFMGVGFGSLKNSFNGDRINLKYIKPFIQPSAGFSSKFIDVAFTPRIALVSYTSKSERFNDASNKKAFDDFWSAKKNTLVFEPGVTVRVGYKSIKIQTQWVHTTFSHSWSFESESYSAVYDDFVSIGLFILVSKRWASGKEKIEVK